MTDPEQSEQPAPKQRKKDWILWSLLVVFILLSIGGMWAIDYYYAPEAIHPDSLPDAVGK